MSTPAFPVRDRRRRLTVCRAARAAVSATVLTMALAALAACGGGDPAAPSAPPTVPSPPPPPLPPAVSGVTAAPASVSLWVGQTRALTAQVAQPAGASPATVTYGTTTPGVATVSDAGVLTAVAAGSATITVTATALGNASAVAATATVAVPVTVTLAPVATVSVTPAAATLPVGTTLALTATARDAAGNVLTGRPLTWSTAAPAVATVSPTGLVTAVAVGSAMVSATVEGVSASLPVTVAPPPPNAVASVRLDLVSDRLLAGVTTEVARAVVVAVSGDVLTDRPVRWSSSAPTVLTVDQSGRLAALAAGQAVLTATVDGKSASALVRVEARQPHETACPFCFVGGSGDPWHPVWDPVARGYKPNPADTRPVLEIDDRFDVPAGQVVRWDGRIVRIRATRRDSIEVRGTLIIRNSLVLWEMTEPQQLSLTVQRNGTLQVENALVLWTSQGGELWANWNYRDGATVSLNHYQGYPWTTLNGAVRYSAVNGSTVQLTMLADARDSEVAVRDAHLVYLELYAAAGRHTLTLPRRQRWASWQAPALWPASSLTIANSYLYDTDIGVSNDRHFTITDSPDGFSLAWAVYKNTPGFVECELTDLGDPNAMSEDEGAYYANRTWTLPCNNSSLTVVNTRIRRAWPVVWGYTRLVVRRSFLVDARNYGAPATLEVYDSVVDMPGAFGGGLVYLENSRTKHAVQAAGAGSTIYAYRVSARGANPFAVYESDGGRFITLSTPGAPWRP